MFDTDSPDGLDTYGHIFLSGQQVIETREGTGTTAAQAETLEPKYQNVWCPRYIDALILRDENTDTDGLCDDTRIFCLADANYNVTALVDTNGNVLERYLYSPYGEITVLDADFSSDADGVSDYDNTTLYTGREFDPTTGLFYYRARYYHAELGKFIHRDPIGYNAHKRSNLYGYCGSMPVRYYDPAGLDYVSVTGSGVYWTVEEDGFWYNPDGTHHLIGTFNEDGSVALRPPYGSGTAALHDLEQASDNFWNLYPDISNASHGTQQTYISSALQNQGLGGSLSPVEEVLAAADEGANAGWSSVCYCYSRPFDWALGYDFGAAHYYDQAWQQSGLDGTWTQGVTNTFAGGSAIAGYGAVGVWAWGAAGMPTYGGGLVGTSETSVMFQVNGQLYMGTSSGVIAYPAGTGWAQMSYWTSITGIPILNAEAAAAGAGSAALWFPNHPCASHAVQALGNGWIPWR